MATLPTIKPMFQRTTLLSSGKEVKIRPFNIGEQKQIILAKETAKNDIDVYKAVIDLIRGCAEGVEPLELYQPEFEKLFYDMRSISDGNELEFTLRYKDDSGLEKDCIQKINTQTELVLSGKNFESIIDVDKNIKCKFRQVKIKDLMSIGGYTTISEESKVFKILSYCLDTVYNGQEVITQFTIEDATAFIDSLPDKVLREIVKFYNEAPSLECTKTFICEGRKEPVKLSREEVRSFLS